MLWFSRLLDEHCGGVDGRAEAARATADAIEACFSAVEAVRKPNADAICGMALENFVEMRDRTGDRKFQAMKKVENRLENSFGDRFRSRYAMVCYGGDGNVSYANARELGKIHAHILETLCFHMVVSGPGVIGNIDTDEDLFTQVESVDMDLASRLIDYLLVPKQRALGIDLATVKH